VVSHNNKVGFKLPFSTSNSSFSSESLTSFKGTQGNLVLYRLRMQTTLGRFWALVNAIFEIVETKFDVTHSAEMRIFVWGHAFAQIFLLIRHARQLIKNKTCSLVITRQEGEKTPLKMVKSSNTTSLHLFNPPLYNKIDDSFSVHCYWH